MRLPQLQTTYTSAIVTKKVLILLASALLVTAIWFLGAEVIYARILAFASNVLLSLAGSSINIAVEEEAGEYLFRVYLMIDGQRGSFPQMIQTLLFPTIIVLSWQLFVAMVSGWRQFLRSAKWNIGLFFAFQVLFLLILTAYHTSAVAAFVYTILMESFSVIAVVIVIIDHIRFPIFTGKKT